MPIAHSHDAVTERYPTKYTRSVKVQISSGMNDVIDFICTLPLRKYPLEQCVNMNFCFNNSMVDYLADFRRTR